MMSKKPMQLGSPQMFYDESWKPIYFVVERLKVKVTIAGVGLCTLLSAGFLFCTQEMTDNQLPRLPSHSW